MKHEDTAQIICHRTTDETPLGPVVRDTFEWEGESPYVYVSSLFFSQFAKIDAEVLNIGPFKLRVFEKHPWSDEFILVRDDYPFWKLAFWWHRTKKWFDLVFARFIVTLAVWKLADFKPYQYPSWRDIRIFKRGK